MGVGPEVFLSFSRNEPLRLLLDALVVNDEEETLLSSIPHNRKKEYFPGSVSIEFLLSMETILDEESAVSLLCGFAFAFDRHAKSFAFSFNAYSSS